MASIRNRIAASRERKKQTKAQLVWLHVLWKSRRRAIRLRHQQHWEHTRAGQKKAQQSKPAKAA